MNPGLPQAFIRIDVADPAQHSLIQQHRLNPRRSAADTLSKLLERNLQGIGAKPQQLLPQLLAGQQRNPPESPRINVAKFPSISEQRRQMRMLRAQLGRSP